VYKVKPDGQGNIVELKARLVATGYSQTAGVDNLELFAPSGQYSTFRVVNACVAGKGLKRRGFDDPYAYLRGIVMRS
jgi:hypothetical protein